MTRIKYMPKHWGCTVSTATLAAHRLRHANVGQLEEMAAGADTVNLTEMGIDKLLAAANPHRLDRHR